MTVSTVGISVSRATWKWEFTGQAVYEETRGISYRRLHKGQSVRDDAIWISKVGL